jgi:3-oxoadipate enol-lactonase
MPTIDVRGATVAYTDTGAPPGVTDAPAVVVGHGLLFGGWMFRAQIAALKDSYRCVAIDWRGQGESPATRDGCDMDSLTADAVALITQLGAGPVHWVGHSMGGFVGQRLAARHGGLLRSLTLLDTSADAEDPARVREQELLALFQLFFGIRPILGKVKPLLFGPAFLADPASAELVGEWVGRLSRIRRRGIRRALHGAAGRAAVTDEIGQVTLPVLVVVGADDRATPPEHARRIASSIDGARLAIVAACGHSSTLEQPDAISALLTEFLAEVDQAGSGVHPASGRQPSADAAARMPGINLMVRVAKVA